MREQLTRTESVRSVSWFAFLVVHSIDHSFQESSRNLTYCKLAILRLTVLGSKSFRGKAHFRSRGVIIVSSYLMMSNEKIHFLRRNWNQNSSNKLFLGRTT